VLDARTGHFVAVNAFPLDRYGRPLSLSPDGRSMLLLGTRHGRQYGGLCLYTFASGDEKWFDTQFRDQIWLAAMSPNRQLIATLFTTVTSVGVGVIDVVSGERQILWTTAGGWSAQSAVSWSPDGQLVTCTYATEDEQHATVLIGIDGFVVGHYDDVCVLGSANGTWLSSGDLVGMDTLQWQLCVMNPTAGTRNAVGEPSMFPSGLLDDRLVVPLGRVEGEPTRFVTTRLDGSDLRSFISAHGDGASYIDGIAMPT
jgi:hypothetical protein